jgi:hypothetical protein
MYLKKNTLNRNRYYILKHTYSCYRGVNMFLKLHEFFCFQLFFLVFLCHFDVFILKIFFKKNYYFYAFQYDT